ncbi:MAG: xylosidase/arabinosidase [Deltaproteobacteria bacterium]|nr:xylosidase/arabinosidase [Deltaproteobacteria bacterium]
MRVALVVAGLCTLVAAASGCPPLTPSGADGAIDAGVEVAIDAGDGGAERDAGTAAGDEIGTGFGELPVFEDPDADAGTLPPDVVDATSIDDRLLFGYQGWFSCEGDGSPLDQAGDGWRHWSPGVTPAPENVSFEMWPDTRELDPAELCPTSMSMVDGSNAGLYSAWNAATVDRHFSWMKQHGLDGVLLQEFVVELEQGSAPRAFRDGVLDNVRAGAEAHGRTWAVMYDISGAPEAELNARIIEHWGGLAASGVLASERYLHHDGRPVIGVWGFGFTDRAGTPAHANALLDWLQRDAPAGRLAFVVGGVPSRWRTLTADSSSDPAWAAVYRRYDVISPWLVGRFDDEASARAYRDDVMDADVAAAHAAGRRYMPVIFPGFSWANLFRGTAENLIPRRGGRLWWTQFYEAKSAGADTYFGAMFDEVDEGTAIMKVAETHAMEPTTGAFLSLDADGEALPSDWYLQLAGAATSVLRGQATLTASRPIAPPLPTCSPPDSELVIDRCVPSCGAAGGDSCDPGVCASRPQLESHDCDVCCDATP